jgi:hypothetical protein
VCWQLSGASARRSTLSDCRPPTSRARTASSRSVCRRADLLTTLSGLQFDQAWPCRVTHRIGTIDVPFLAREDLIRNKRATGRAKDLADLEALGESAR